VYLEEGMRAMRRKAVRADAKATEQAKDVLLILSAILVDPTTSKECLCHQSFKPCRLHTITHHHHFITTSISTS
jgi:hypothetical protein